MTSAAASLAIIGYGCRLPGGVDDGPSFWKLLCDGRDAIREVPPDRWNARALFSTKAVAGKTTSKWAGLLDQIDQFEPECFGISPREAAYIDPQQRLLLETTWEAMEHAGIPADSLAGSRTGVFVGISTNDYGQIQSVAPDLRGLTAFTAQGTCFSIAANRISYCFDLRGPSFIVDTACSSSLVALDRAARSLQQNESDIALVGGVNVIINVGAFVTFSAASMLSPEGRCKAFDASANGFVRAEGAGIVLLKRLDEAVAAGDRIHAVLLATGVNQDGRTSGMAMPNGAAQEALLREVYARAGLEPQRIRYVEAHGTGTAIGDPTEAGALGRVLGGASKRDAPLIVGSVKTNIGHLEAGAGMASLIKSVLMVKHRHIPPSLHWKTPNPHIPFDELGIRVPQKLEPWPSDDPAVIGINSFGFGGTNAHAVVAEYRNGVEHSITKRNHRRSFSMFVPGAALMQIAPPDDIELATESNREVPIVISARNADALNKLCDGWLELLEQAKDSNVALADIAATAAQRRTHCTHVLAFIASSFADAREKIRAFRAGEAKPGVYRTERTSHAPSVAFTFSGQGPQWHAMGRELLAAEPVFRQTMEACDALLRPVAGWSLIEELRKDEAESRIQLTQFAQPALFALQVSLAELWRSWGIKPAVVLGHSVGELAAAHIAGAIPLETAVNLIARRGRCLQEHALPGRMLAAALGEADAQALVAGTQGRIGISAINSPEMVTLGGAADAIDALASDLAKRSVWCKALQVRHAFHTALVEPARDAFLDALVVQDRQLACPMISTVTGERMTDGALGTDYWWQNIRQPVRFAAAVRTARELGVTTFLEIGPHPVLAAAIKQCRAAGEPSARTWPSLSRGTPEQQAMLASLVGLFCAGAKVAWGNVLPRPSMHVELPRHPWTRQRYWHECEASQQMRSQCDHHPLLGTRASGRDRRWQTVVDSHELAWIKDHRVGGRTMFPAAAFVEMALAAATRSLGSDTCTIDDLSIYRPLVFQEAGTATLQLSVDPDASELRIASRTGEAEDAWLDHAQASFRASAMSAPTRTLNWDTCHAQSEPTPGSAVYEAYRATGIEYGPTFRGIVEVKRGESNATARIALPDICGSDEAFIVHPALLDACFQVLLETLPPEDRSSESMYLPERIDRIVLHRRPGKRAFSEVRLASATRTASVGDLRVCTEAGELALEITGFRCRAMQRPADRSRQAISECFYRTTWHHRALPTSVTATPALVLRDGLKRLSHDAHTAAVSLWHDRSTQDADAARSSLDRLALGYVLRAMRKITGRPHRPSVRVDVNQLIARGTLQERSRVQVERCIAWLVELGMARPLRRGVWRVSFDEERDLDGLWRECLTHHPESYPSVRLTHLCGSELPSFWSGKVDPLEVLFSREGVDVLEQVYRDDEWLRYANAVVAQIVAGVIARCPERPLRILEVGAGTGGTTAAVLSVVPQERTEYWFTDTSQFFLARAQEKFHAFSCVQYRLLDVEVPFENQDIPAGSFDIIIAADVLHAVRDVRAAVERCRTALVAGGLLVLRELSRSRIGLDVIFGSTDGWWNYRGDPLRPTSALLTPQEWSSLLEREGFEQACVPGGGSDAVPFAAVIVARARAEARSSTGIVVAPVPTDAVPPERTWLIVSDGDALPHEVALWMRTGGLRCLEIGNGARFKQLGPDRFDLDFTQAKDRQKFAQLAREFDSPYSVLDVRPLTAPANEPSATSCARIVALLQALGASSTTAPRRLMLLIDAASPNAAVTIGTCRVAANEFGGIGVRMVTLQSEDPARFDRIRAEIVADTAEEEIAWRAGHRFVPRLELAAGMARTVLAERERKPVPFALVPARSNDLDSLKLRECRARAPRRDEVAVEVHFAALNFRDVLKALGRYPTDDPRQLELGDECTGIVRKVGRDVRHVKPGDRVAVCSTGTLRSLVTVPAESVLPIPPNLHLQSAVSMPVAFLTADHALRDVGKLSAGETVLIHAAAGGVGLAAMQIARRIGARIFATAGSAAKRDLVSRLGAERVMDSRSLKFFDEVMEATMGRGVDVVLNSLAGQAMMRSLACLAPGGRFLELGKRDLYENTHVGLWPLRRNVSYHAIDLSALLTRDAARSNASNDALGWSTPLEPLRALFAATAAGELAPLPVRVMPVTRAAEAFRLMAQGGHMGKVVLDMTQHDNQVHRASRHAKFSATATYLITGAFGGTGLALARWLVDRGARHLALLSRQGPQSAAARELLDALRQSGVDARVMTCDVTNRTRVAEVLGSIERDMPPLAGVFHLAMVIDDRVIQNLDGDRIARSMAAKVEGARNLDFLTRERALQCFVLFSSASASVGNFGQASYAAANAFLEQLARERRAAGLPGTAIAWGMLGESGYVAERPELVESLTQLGLLPLSAADVRNVLDIALTSSESTLLAARIDWQRISRRFGGHAPRANLISNLMSGTAEASATEGAGSARDAIKAADPAERPALIAEYVRKTAARVLGMAPAKIGTDRPLAEMGLDSLMGVELAGQVESELGVAFPMSALGNEITIARIADTLARAFGTTPAAQAAAPQARDTMESCIVPLSGAADRPPLFCFHPAGGELSIYNSVAKELAEKYRVIGIQSRVVAGAAEEFASLGDMATAYADLVQRQNPGGPHYLFGFSFGGILALHTARILLDRGEPVAWVGIAETRLQWSANQEHTDAFAGFLLELYEHIRDELHVVKHVPPDALRAEMREVAQSLIAQADVKHAGNGNGTASALLMDWLTKGGYLPDGMPRGMVEQYVSRVAAHLELVARDRSSPTVDVPLHVWKAADGVVPDGDVWHAITKRPVNMRTVQGTHFDVMAPPHSQVIAAELAGLMTPRMLS